MPRRSLPNPISTPIIGLLDEVPQPVHQKKQKAGTIVNSREIVQRTLDYARPERLAASFPEPFWNDLAHTHYVLQGYQPEWRQVAANRQEYIDEWGNTWARVDATSKGEVARGALQSWDDLDNLQLPNLADPANFWEVEAFCEDGAEGRYRVGGLPGFPFNIARKIRRLDQFFMDLMLNPDQVRELLQRLENLLAAAIEQYARAGVDAIMFPEDWGTQDGLMIRPDTWRTFFKPGFEHLCDVAHQNGIKVFMHSCGKITVIILDLIEAGVDLLQFDQPTLHGIDILAQYHGQITFWCPVDIQKTLQTKDADQIAQEARHLVEALGGPEGGFIAGYYQDNASIGLDPRWQNIACRAFMQCGRYQDEASL